MQMMVLEKYLTHAYNDYNEMLSNTFTAAERFKLCC